MIRKHYAEGRWGQIHVRLNGSTAQPRPPLLMLHPTPKSGWIWEPLMTAPRLADTRIMIAPDTPGYGASDAPPAPPAIEDYADEMCALLRDLARDGAVPAGPVDIMGYHTGSVIAVAMAARAPDLVRRLVLTSLPTYSAEERALKRAGLAQWRGPSDDGAHLLAMWTLMQGLADPRADLAWRQASFAENLRCGPRAPWGYDAVYRFDLEAALPQLARPVLVLNPQDDLHAQTLRGVAVMKVPRLVELPGVGHGLFALETTRIATIVGDFLDGD
jgi:pimeloyl-ACP methyl ester carboxylesterase